jgi:hypothetical protein
VAPLPFELEIPPSLRRQGWRVKIRDRERLEPPHVSILRRRWTWRIGLRGGRFLDRTPSPAEVPDELVSHVRERLEVLRVERDARYPENPVGGPM